ncbi:hypothetical protein OPT61_g8476 [Boeremia exigua]|uniref:Uncharacterized protein n=1 Tax=Boeremia exigua TaxID=749465 RepID=A0ACC2HYQ0_9PLEO|nr:hypothetical protein OPT61_g8476 [Boeremia exigua]
MSRAKSAFRGYDESHLHHSDRGGATLTAGDDYLFRIQVISSASYVNPDVFKKAVQGLVKICFPQHVLDEIGIEVVTQHMRNEGAPEHNIAHMTKIFQSEMIQRVTSMLATYVDTQAGANPLTKAVMAASNIHRAEVDEDVLNDITENPIKLREQVLSGSTIQLASSADPKAVSLPTTDSHTAVDRTKHSAFTKHTDHGRSTIHTSETLSEEETRKVPLIKQGCSPRSHQQSHDTNVALRRTNETSQPRDTLRSTKKIRHGKESKVSTSWRWNVQDVSRIGDIAEHFKITSDLFAYHALPIAKQRLGAEAKRKQLRQDIEGMLAAMHADEFDKWAESFHKLSGGDLNMLDRQSLGSSNPEQHTDPANFASTVDRPGTGFAVNSSSTTLSSKHTLSTVQSKTAAQVQVEQDYHGNGVVLGVQPLAQGRSNTDQRIGTNHTGPLRFIDNSNQQNNDAPERSAGHNITKKSITAPSKTPIIDLLWGHARLELKDNSALVQSIVKSLSSRVPVEARFPLNDFNTRIRIGMERELQPWILSSLSAFPELIAESFIFVNIMPNFTTFVGLFFDPEESLTALPISVIQNRLLAGLKARISLAVSFVAFAKLQISGLTVRGP